MGGFSLKNNRFLANSSWIIGANSVQMLLSFVIGMISARYLGPSNYGIINYAASFVAFFTSIASLGMEGVLVSELTKKKYPEDQLLGTTLLMGLASSLLSTAVILILIGFLQEWNALMLLVTFLQSLTLVFKAFNVFDYWFQAQLLSKYPSVIRCVAYVLMSAYKIFLLITQKSVAWFAFSLGLDTLLIAIGLCICYFARQRARLQINPKLVSIILKQSSPFILSGLISVIYTQIDKIMIGEFLNDNAQVGLYTASQTICNIWLFLPQAFITSARPVIIEMKEKNSGSYIQRLKQLYALLLWGCVLVSGIVTLLSPLVVRTLYGEDYMATASNLRILIWYTPFSMLGTARSIWVLCEKKNRFVWRYLCVGSVTNVLLNAVLIPLMGIDGAAIATVIAQFISAIIAPVFFKETRIHTKYVLEAALLKGIKP